MVDTIARRRRGVVTTFGVLAVLYAITFFLGAWLHLGARIPLGFAVLEEPRILPAGIVETLCGLALAVSGYAVLTGKTWAWRAAVGAHGFALAGVLLGMAALAAGRGPSTELNNAYHLTMLAFLGAGLVVLLTRPARAVLDRIGVTQG
ncbi:MAG TPA: hypothetical protein VG452_05040 [Egibacteraceae bacterium]|nr:hypothetical protein [Actinomycetota bacterium]HWB71565.1 hypothetical protein [Egibacteraceae bacterium]